MPKHVKPQFISNVKFLSETGISVDSKAHGVPRECNLLDLTSVGNSNKHVISYLPEDSIEKVTSAEKLSFREYPYLVIGTNTYFRFEIRADGLKLYVALKATKVFQPLIPATNCKLKRLDSMSLDTLELILGRNPMESADPVPLYTLGGLKLLLQSEFDLAKFISQEDVKVLILNPIVNVYRYEPICIGDKLVQRYILRTEVKDIILATQEPCIKVGY